MSERNGLQLTIHQHATILAALRYWQDHVRGEDVSGWEHFSEYNNGEKAEPLDDIELDELCEELNCSTEIVLVDGLGDPLE